MSLSETIHKERYAQHGEETWQDTSLRVAKSIAKAEKDCDYSKWEEEFNNALLSFDFIPGGRILANAGKPKPFMMNCFVVDTEDSRESIGEMLKDILIISGTGGGVGISFSKLRPKGVEISTNGGFSSGPISFMECADMLASTIKTGGGRRAALLLGLSVYHPDIMEFLHYKLDLKKLNNANISVEVDNKFIQAVKDDATWDLVWAGKVHKTIKAKDLWDKMVENSWKSGEPGILNMGYMKQMSNSEFFAPVVITNPCLSGETSIAVADGRGNISIRQLAEEGKDVPVYCRDGKGKIIIKLMRNPRITGHEDTYKITLDDGSEFKVTGNHKFLTKEGVYKEVQDISIGESLEISYKMEASIKDVFPKANSKSQNYIWLRNASGRIKSEHRLIYEFVDGTVIPKHHVIHHKDYNAKNNRINNLLCLSRQDHDKLHRQDKLGKNNPVFKILNSDRREGYLKKLSKASTGILNGNAKKTITNKDIIDFTKNLMIKFGYKISIKTYQKYAKQSGIPLTFTVWRKQELGSLPTFLENIAKDCNMLNIDPRMAQTLQNMEIMGYAPIIKNNSVQVNRICEICGDEFYVHHSHREQGMCSETCKMIYLQRYRTEVTKSIQNTFKNKLEITKNEQLKVYNNLKFNICRTPLKKEWEQACRDSELPFRVGTKNGFKTYTELQQDAQYFNHKVVSIKHIGKETVYNGTVDTVHNFYIVGKDSVSKFGKTQQVLLNNLQCGEVPLSPYESCCLGSVNVSNFVKEKNLDRKRFEKAIEVGIRFLDNVLTLNEYPLGKIQSNVTAGRRIGLGLMGLHYAMLKLGIKYSSEEGVSFTEKVYEILRNHSYWVSSEIAKERGSFPKFNPETYLKNNFVKTLPTKIRDKIREDGMRNVCVNSQAPTGTSSILANVSSGIEPIFSPVYERTFWSQENKEAVQKKEIVADELFTKWIEEGRDISHFEGSHDISPEWHLLIQEAAQRYVDNALSKTINIPEDYPMEDLSELLLKYVSNLKGVTVYRDGSRGDSPLKPLDSEKYFKRRNEEASDIGKMADCATGTCEI